MPLENILLMLDEELARLQQARVLLASTGKISSVITRSLQAPQKRRVRALSAESRRRIAEAQRKRWAARRQEAQKSGNKKSDGKA